MEGIQLVVTNQAGECVGSFSEKGFRKWQRNMQHAMGGKIGVAIGEKWLVDCQASLRTLPAGLHEGTIIRKIAIPMHVRRELKGCDAWKAL